jgi:hypothetical protein
MAPSSFSASAGICDRGKCRQLFKKHNANKCTVASKEKNGGLLIINTLLVPSTSRYAGSPNLHCSSKQQTSQFNCIEVPVQGIQFRILQSHQYKRRFIWCGCIRYGCKSANEISCADAREHPFIQENAIRKHATCFFVLCVTRHHAV